MATAKSVTTTAKKPKLVYVVMEAGWEYNDEYYTSSEGGTVKIVFSSKEKAQKAANAASIKYIKNHVNSIGDYQLHDDADEKTEAHLGLALGIWLGNGGKPYDKTGRTQCPKSVPDWLEDNVYCEFPNDLPEEFYYQLMLAFGPNKFHYVVESEVQ